MRAKEFIIEDNIDEAMPKWAKGALGGLALGAGLMSMNNKPEPVSQPKPVVQQTAPKPTVNPDIMVLAQTMWGEARQEGKEGMLAVGNVIKNRAEENSRLFGQGIRGVALKPKQFSCWNKNDPNRKRMLKIVELDKLIQQKKSPTGEQFEEWFKKFQNTGMFLEYKAWVVAKQLAEKIVNGQMTDPTKGATFYHTKQIKPSWASKMQKIHASGNHIFYDLPKKS